MRFLLMLTAFLFLAGCSKSVMSVMPQNASPQSQGTRVADPLLHEHSPDLTYKVLYRFGTGLDGSEPAGLTPLNGAFYGVTSVGGGNGCGNVGCGTVFKITTSGAEQVIYTFQGGSDGNYPETPLVAIKGVLYGATTAGGGTSCENIGCGTIFKITTSGQETVLYRFTGASDGAFPDTALLDVNGAVYGATLFGGGFNVCPAEGYYVGCGTVFKVTLAGKETLLYPFEGGADGGWPEGNLLNLNGELYSTTYLGGNGGCSGNGCGTIYEMSLSGKETQVYAFKGGADGSGPEAGLTDFEGALYGTTSTGGGSACGGAGCGTIFKTTTGGSEGAIYAFKGGKDGAQPLSGLTKVSTDLYGSTESGGTGKCPGIGSVPGCGTIFKIAGGQAETVIHSFKGGLDGAYPFLAPLYDKGILYGVTTFGGGHGCDDGLGCGVAFSQSL